MPKIALPKSFGLYTHGDGTRRSYPPSLPGLTMNLAVQEASDRLLAAATTGAPPSLDGWTDLDALINSPAYASSRIVYVSTSGNDGTGQIYSPTSPALGGVPTNPTGTVAPYATLAAAWAQIRTGQADVMLMRRGDTWSANLALNKLGASLSARIIVAAYGSIATARPQVGEVFPTSNSSTGNLLLAHYRINFSGGGDRLNAGTGVRYEGIHFEGVGDPSTVFAYANVGRLDVVRCTHRRCRLFTFDEIGRGNMTFIDNVMWHPVDYVGAGGFEHNNYFQFTVGDIDSRRNISVHSPGVGFRQRGLGTVEANLILGNNTARGPLSVFDIGTNTYYGTGDPGNRGTFLNFRYNLALHYPGRHSFYDIRNAVIEHNILRGEGQHLTYFENTANPGNPPPLVNATLQDNIFYGAYLIQSEGHSGSVTGPYLIRRNDFQRPAGGALINAQSNDFTYESNNRFWSSSPQADWFTGYTNSYAAYVPSRGSNTQVTYPDPDRDLVTYMQSLGYSPASAEQAIDWFTNGTFGFAGAINNRLGLWDERATARAVINHVRAGFGLGAIP